MICGPNHPSIRCFRREPDEERGFRISQRHERQLDRLEAAVDQKLDQYRSLCVEIKSLKSQIPTEAELTEQQEKLKTLQGEAQDLKEDLKDPEVDTAELDKELSEARKEQEKLNSIIQKKEQEKI